jgi:hypothetical protein
MYMDMHDFFFVEFPCFLFKWIKRKTITNSHAWSLELVAWDQAKIEELKVFDNKWT